MDPADSARERVTGSTQEGGDRAGESPPNPAYTLSVIEFLIAAAVFGLSGGLSPGPLLTLVVAETLARGRSAGLAVAASPLITDGPIIAVTVLLFGRIENSESALGILSVAGGLLLGSYGVAGFAGAPEDADEVATDRGVWNSLGKGVSVNLLNPSPYLFWLTIGTPMLLRARHSSLAAAIAFLVVFYLGLVGSKAVLAVLVARSRSVLRGRAYILIKRTLAAVLLIYAFLFIRSGVLELVAHAK
jgi:threonine/homoserine/homoserine lactone efflux protein